MYLGNVRWNECVRIYRTNGMLYASYTLPTDVNPESVEMTAFDFFLSCRGPAEAAVTVRRSRFLPDSWTLQTLKMLNVMGFDAS